MRQLMLMLEPRRLILEVQHKLIQATPTKQALSTP